MAHFNPNIYTQGIAPQTRNKHMANTNNGHTFGNSLIKVTNGRSRSLGSLKPGDFFRFLGKEEVYLVITSKEFMNQRELDIYHTGGCVPLLAYVQLNKGSTYPARNYEMDSRVEKLKVVGMEFEVDLNCS